MINSPLIKFSNVWKTYNLGKIKLDVLKNINLEIKNKEFVIIIGSSGSGKSTLLNLISCLDKPSKGNIIFKGKNISELSEDELSEIRGKKIGFIFQRFNLLNHLTALENVLIPTIFQKIPEPEALAKAKEILKKTGLELRMNHRPGELSGGENQRVAVARSLVNNPEIIVADEPTGNLDSKTGIKIMETLKNLNREGKTIIMVTHDRELISYGSKVITIKDGEIKDE
jgi:putative ABC transport system ATP-binding protein